MKPLNIGIIGLGTVGMGLIKCLIDNKEITNSHEDGFFCILHRQFLESKGFEWANFKIASHFSIESPINLNEILDFPFGFHGKKIILFIKLIKLISKIKNL